MTEGMTGIRVVPRRGIGPGSWARSLDVQRHYVRRKGVPPRRANHMETSSSRFFCKTCGLEVSSPEAMNAHWRAEHPEIFSEAWYQKDRNSRRVKAMKNDERVTCVHCGREGTWSSIRVHQAFCPSNPNRKLHRGRKGSKTAAPARKSQPGAAVPLKGSGEDVPIEIARGLVNDALDLLAATRKAGITITAT